MVHLEHNGAYSDNDGSCLKTNENSLNFYGRHLNINDGCSEINGAYSDNNGSCLKMNDSRLNFYGRRLNMNDGRSEINVDYSDNNRGYLEISGGRLNFYGLCLNIYDGYSEIPPIIFAHIPIIGFFNYLSNNNNFRHYHTCLPTY